MLVVGMDGATWDLLSRFVLDGTMPNLGRLRRESKWGVLKSTIPPVTAPAWAALSTGKNPGKTGVYAFYTPADSIDRFRPISSLDVRADTLPEVLERAGLQVHVVNLPTFSYPRKIKGTVLGDLLCPPGEVVHPDSLLQEAVFREYRSFPNMSMKHDPVRYVRDVRRLERVRFNCTEALLQRPWDFVFVMFSGVDWVQHELYGELVAGTESPATSEAISLFKDLDQYIGRFLSALGPADHIIMVSDHGFRRTTGTVSLNSWLIKNGYLTPRAAKSFAATIAGRLPAFTVPGALVDLFSRSSKVWGMARGAWRATAGETGFTGRLAPDPGSSVAFSQDFTWGVYINGRPRFSRGLLSDSEARRAAEEIRRGLDGLAKAGLIRGCVPSGEVYSGEHAHLAPDLIVMPADRGVSVTRRVVVEDVPQNGHSMEGIYLLHGPEVSPGESAEASICDIFPTVLAIFGLGIPSDIDGRSMTVETTLEESSHGERSSRRVLSPEDEKAIHARLHDLGYV